jgi:diguanylate cyclase (GGDEF)-like protein
MIAVLLAAGLILLDKEDAGIEALRTTLLLAVLVVLCGLVLILRALIAEREALAARVYQPGVLDRHGFEKGLDRELSRSGRHARPLAVVLLQVTGAFEADPDSGDHERVVTAVARTILGRIRAEDSAAHIGDLQFAILAPETSAEGAASVAETITEVVRKRLLTLGYEGSSFDIAVGWADYPHRAQSRNELLGVARAYLEAAVVQNELRPAKGSREASPATRPATAGPGSS